MTPAVDRIPKYIPSKYNDWHYKNNSKYYDDDWDDWYGNPRDSGTWDSMIYANPATTQITAQATIVPQFNATTMSMNTTAYTTSQPITITFAGTIDQAAVDAITHQLSSSLTQQQMYLADPPTPKRKQGPREFNKYINGSDLVEQFIRYCGTLGVRQGEVMDIPIDSFIKWLIIEACVVDQEEPEVTLELGPSPQPRCLGCGRYVPRGSQVLLHDERCAGFHFRRQKKQMEVAHARSDSPDGGDRRVLSGVGAPGT